MKILFVAATKFEIQPLILKLELQEFAENNRCIKGNYKNLEINCLITGIGMVATAYFTAKVLDDSYDLAINMGICGTFDSDLEIGSVINICEDCIAEMGAEDDENFLSMEELKLDAITKISNRTQEEINQVAERLTKVVGITVNKVHGNERAIKKTVERLHPNVESMEGAAFMFACAQERIPYLQIRAVSNKVEKRNKDRWNIPLAIENLNKKIQELLDSI